MSVELPLVSICIPTFNGARYVEEAIRSAFAQTYPNLEMVISDDGSVDDTLAIVERLRPECPMPMVILHHEAAGIGANWNHCLRHATGTYVKFLFQDDLITPDCIERMVKMAVQDPDVGLVYCRRHIIHDPGNPAHTAWVRRFGAVHLSWGRLAVSEGIMDGKAYLRDPNLLMHPRNKIGEPTAVLLHRRVFDREGLFDERLKQMLDYFHWYKVMRHFKVAFVDAELASFRLHDDQATSRNNRAASLPEYAMLPGLYLRHFFWQVAPTVRWALLKQGTKAGRLLVRTGLIQ